MREIPLTQGKIALVDDEDFKMLNKYKWIADRVDKKFYAARNGLNKNKGHVRMHRQIMNFPIGFEIDHVDGNSLNNQRANLRVCTSSQNKCNAGKQINNTTGYLGVCFYKRDGNFQADITLNKKTHFLGRFTTAIDAAKVYDIAAKKYHGKFAKTNFKEEP
jgi:hypothetical protein